jgi:hypothetical protein
MATQDSMEIGRSLASCARDCEEALQALLHTSMSSMAIGILAGHGFEAALKAHLAGAGWKEQQLKSLGHDLLKIWSAARAIGLKLSDPPPKWFVAIAYNHFNLRFRYPDPGSFDLTP